jgi:hypothetical protein
MRYLFLLLAPAALLAQTSGTGISFNNTWQIPLQPVAGQAPDYFTGQNVNFGGVLFPHFHLTGVSGDSTGTAADLAAGHHDPQRDGFTFQGVELGTSLRAGDWQGFANIHVGYDHAESSWEHEYEEAFLKYTGLEKWELRAGRFYNRFGLQNTLHLHGWDWADQYLLNGRFLGDDGLSSIGAEVNYYLPVQWTSLLTFSVGQAPDMGDHHHDDEEEEGEEPEFEGEGAGFADQILSANWTNQANYNDFHQFRFGLSGLWADNNWGRRSNVLGAHFEYQWREDGYAMTGRYLRWRTEFMLRRMGAVSGHLPGEEEEHEGEEEEGEEEEEAIRRATLSEVGAYTDLRYGWAADGFQLGLRAEYLQGIDEAALPRRTRISPGVSYFFNPNRTLYVRVQYNYDQVQGARDEHSVWAQFGFNWGGPEVR